MKDKKSNIMWLFFTFCIAVIQVTIFVLQEIDGKALMLLNSDLMMKYMGLKLGPALKLCHIIDKLKGKK